MVCSPVLRFLSLPMSYTVQIKWSENKTWQRTTVYTDYQLSLFSLLPSLDLPQTLLVT